MLAYKYMVSILHLGTAWVKGQAKRPSHHCHRYHTALWFNTTLANALAGLQVGAGISNGCAC